METPDESKDEQEPEQKDEQKNDSEGESDHTTAGNTDSSEETEEDLTLTKKELKSLMDSENFDVIQFMKRMYESKNYCLISSEIKNDEKKTFLANRTEEEMYQILLATKYTLFNEYLRYSTFEVEKTDMTDLTAFLTDYRFMLEQWLEIELGDEDHLTDEQKRSLEQEVLSIILEKENLNGIGSFSEYDEILKKKTTKIDMSGLMDIFNKIDFTSRETLESTFNNLVNYTYKIYGMESMNGEPISPKPSLSKRRVRSVVAASTTPNNGQEVSVANGLYYITSYTSSFALQTDANGKVDKTNVTLWSTTGSGFGRAEQRWMIQKQSNGWYKIIANSSYKIPDDGIGRYYNAKKCLDVVDGSKASGTNVDIYTNNSTDAQYWKFYYYNGRYIIKNKLGCVLDVKDGNIASGTNVQVFTQNNSNAQQWTLSKITNDTVYLNKKLTKSGNGYSASSPVRNMSEAYDLLQYCGGTIYILGKAWNVTTTVTLTESSYANAGGYPSNINLLSGCKLTIKRYSGYKGELMTVASNGNLTLKNLTMDGNRSNVTKCTGVMLSNKGKLYLNNCIFQNAYSYNVPAALWSGNNFTADKCTFKNNTPYRDSGWGPASTYTVSCQGGDNNYDGVYNFNNCTFSGNSDQSAVEIFHGMGYFTNCNFTNNTNTSTDGYAAAIGFNSGGGTLTNCTFDGNVSSKDGGAIHVNNSDDSYSIMSKCPFTAKGCIFKNNKAGSNGGVVMLWNSHQVNKFESCQFLDNTASGNGGCITVGGLSQANLLSNTFEGNSAGGNGGTINESSTAGKMSVELSKNIFTNNTAKNRGGAVVTTTKASITGNTFTGNTAGSGGAVDFNGKTGSFTSSGNTYKSNSSTFEGGAVSIGAADSTKFDNEYFENNSSVSGGAVAVTYKNTTITNSQFYNNSVAPDSNNMYGSGGAVYVRNATNVTLAGNTYNGNTARWGGAVDIQAATSATLTDEVMTSNRTSGGGGAIHNNGTSTKIVNGTYTDNYSPTSGGAICNSGIMTISYSSDGDTSGIFKNNTAGTDGGAISSYVQDVATPTVTLNGITFEGNSSKVGGAIYVQKNTVLNSSNATYKNNTATSEGGAICNKGIVSIDSGTVTGNTAPEGAAICQNGTLELGKLATIATDNDIYLHNNKFVTVPAALSNNFVARITPSDYTLGRTCVRNTYGAKGSALEPKFTLTPNGSYFLYGGDLISSANNADVVISRNYPVTYDCGTSPNPTGHFSDGTNLDDEDVKEWGVDYELRTDKPTAKGYLFSGWNTEEDGSGDDYFPGDTYSENEALYLYAQWTPIKYTVAYNGNGSTSGSMLTQTFTYGKSYNLAANGFVRSGYHFAGWNTKADGSGTSYADKQSVKNLASTHGAKITLYAQWVKNTYTIRFHANDGAGSMADVTVPYDTSYNLPANKFTYQGYTFDKWKTEDGTSVYRNEAAIKYSSSQLKNGVLNLYAQWKINQYTLTITGDSGVETITGSGTYNYGTTANVTYQIKPGYHIKNITGTTADGDPNGAWTGHTGKSGTITDTWTVKACNRTIVVHTEPNTYTVKYDGNGNTGGSTASSSHTYDTAKALTANGYTKTGYSFNGWNTKADGSGTAYADKASVKNLTTTNGGTVTLYAQWTAKKYTVAYNANGGSGTMAADTATYGSGYVTKANAFSRTGYTFKGWNEKADGTGTDWTNWIGKSWTWTYTKNITLYAQWTAKNVTVTFHRNTDSNDTTTSQQTFTYDVVGQKFTDKGWSKTGYTLLGWSTDKNATNASYSVTNGVSNDWINKNSPKVDLYGVWKANIYTVKYDGNGNTGGSTASSSHTYDTAKALTANGFTKTGYTFKGWNTKADGSGTSYADKASVKNLSSTNGATVTLYAQWTANKYIVTYNANGGSGTMATDKATYGAGYVTKENVFSRTGYTFVGWNEKADGTGTDWTSWIGKSWTWTYTKNITLYAQWTKNSYYLDLNGWLDGKSTGNITGYGTADIYVDGVQKANDVTDFYQKIPYGSKYEIKDIKAVIGHTYVGVHSGNITGTIGTSNVGVVLEFRTNKYTVTFDKNNGTGTMKGQTFTYGVKQALTVNAFSRTGYTFTGWNTKADGSGTTYTDKQEVTSLTAADGATITLYAQWKINSYTLTYDPNGGTVTPTSKTLTYGSQYGALPTPSRTGYTFTGWFTAASGGSKVGTATTMGAGNTTVYAHWRANVLTVNYYPNGATKVDTSSVADGSTVSTIDSSAKYRSDTFNYDASLPSYGLWDARRFIRTGYTSTNKYHANSVTGTILLDAGNNVYTKTQDLASAVGKLLELEKGDVSISIYVDWKANAYTVKYNGNGNTGGSTAGSSHTYDTAKGLTANGFTKTGYTFKNWNTKADGSGTSYADKASVKNLTAIAGATVTLYAQWTANKYTVAYNANGGTGTMANQELTYDKAATLNANTFKRTGYRFSGWNTKADGTGTSYADKASVKNLTANSGGTVTLYAKWYSAAPELEAKDATYYEGQDITKAMLLKNVTKASDAEDGDMTGKVIITKIEYSAGKLVDGKPQAAYTKSWTNGMPDSEKLDTWFQQLPKEKAPVTHKITYQVTDLSGKTTTKTSTITVKYNEFPVIKAEDRYFTMEDAKAGKITQDVLLKDAIASGKLKATDAEDGTINNRITIVDYKDTDFKNVNGNTVVWVTFKVEDSMGKETIQEIKVNVIDSGSDYWRDDEGTARKQVRFITQKYYDKNKDTDFHGMTSEEIEASSDNGGLNVMSKWYQNAAYKALLTGSFAKDAGTDYKISAEKAKELKQKIESNGIGNSKSSNALTDIYNSLK